MKEVEHNSHLDAVPTAPGDSLPGALTTPLTDCDSLACKQWSVFRPLTDGQVRRFAARFASEDLQEFLLLSRQIQALLIAAQDSD